MRTNFFCCCALLMSAVALLSVTGTQARFSAYYMRVTQVKPQECKYEGYKPAGDAKKIEPIASPVAEGFKSSLGFIAKVIGQTAGVGRAGTAALATAAAKIEKVAKVAKKLSAGFGVFAAAFGVVSAFTKPSPNDILKKVNKAFEKMTKDINNRLKSMEGYVDARVIKLEQNLIKNEFAALQRRFTSCIRETTEQEVRTCQRNANKKIYGELPNFQKLSSKFKENAKTLAIYDVKRLEATLLAFRDYASLHLTSLQLLVNSYKDDPYSKEKRSRLNLYLKDLKEMGNEYYKYAHWAYNIIHKGKIDNNYKQNKPKYGKVYPLREGFWEGVHTYDNLKMHPVCVPNDDTIPINKCELKVMVRVDGKKPGSPYKERWVQRGSFGDVLKRVANEESKKLCNGYINSLKRDIEIFWKKELLDVADTWKKVAQKAVEDLSNLDMIMNLKPAPTQVPLNMTVPLELMKTGADGKSPCKKLYKVPGLRFSICVLEKARIP